MISQLPDLMPPHSRPPIYPLLGCPKSPTVSPVKSHLVGVLLCLWESGTFVPQHAHPSMALLTVCSPGSRLRSCDTRIPAWPGSGLPRLEPQPCHVLAIGPFERATYLFACDLAQNKYFEKDKINQPAGPQAPGDTCLASSREPSPCLHLGPSDLG